MTEPWYHAGLRFQCTQCGHCCTGQPGYVWVTAEDIQAIADYRGEAVEQFHPAHARSVGARLSLREKANGDCVFYDRKRGCTVYPARPPQCRTWPFWESNVATPEGWERTCQSCPGSGQGELIPCDEIVKQLQRIRL